MASTSRPGKAGRDAVGRKRDEIVFSYPSAELLEKGLGELGFPAGESVAGVVYPQSDGSSASVAVRGVQAIIPLVNRYIRELELFNAVFDLVGAETGGERGRQDLVVRHILDSLAPWKEIARLAAARSCAVSGPGAVQGSHSVDIADAGSGAGFPGIPLAIAFPDMRVTLIERMSKRCAFLENCVAMLGLKNVTVLNSEVESAPAHAFDIVAFRAFRPLDESMARTLLRLAKDDTDGVLAAWKARRDKIDEEMAGIRGIVGAWSCVPTAVPFLGHEERHLVVIASAERRNQGC